MRIPTPWRRLATACALAAALVMLSGGMASAHAHLVQADPAPDGVIAAAPRVATFVFDEPLNPALTRVRVTTVAGTPVTTTTGHLAPGHNGELWQLPLPALGPGTYSVIWTSESATDGHVMSSFYTFRVASSGGTGGVGAVTGTAGGVYGGGNGTGGVSGLLGGAVAVALATWLGLMAQALWLGALVIDLAVLGPARRAGETPEGRLAAAATRPLWVVMRASIPAAPVVPATTSGVSACHAANRLKLFPHVGRSANARRVAQSICPTSHDMKGFRRTTATRRKRSEIFAPVSLMVSLPLS